MKHITRILCIGLLAMAFVACDKEEETATPISVKTPRKMVGYEGKIYVTCYSPASVIRIDTSSLEVEAICPLGDFNPEGIALAGGKLYVASSGISDETGNYTYDDKVYVVNPSSFSVEKTITVGTNPVTVTALDNQRIVVCYQGEYNNPEKPAGTAIINTADGSVQQVEALSNVCTYNGNIYGYNMDWNTYSGTFYMIDGNSLVSNQILTDAGISTPYSIEMINGNLLIGQSSFSAEGDLFHLTTAGELLWKVESGVGQYPSKIVNLGNGSAYVLNEGGWGANNASISKVDIANGTITADVFAKANGRGLGDVAQDLLKYGSKVYAAVSFSNSIEVIDPATDKSSRINL